MSYLGFLAQPESSRYLAELGYRIRSNLYYVSGSFLILGTQHKDEEYWRFYRGINGSAGFSVGDPIEIFTGVGIFGSQIKNCSQPNTDETFTIHTRNNSDYLCRTNFLLGIFPEVGVRMKFGSISLGLYHRAYKTFHSGENVFPLSGGFIGYQF